MQKRGKKGLSTIVITLIIILISLVAVGIIWVVVRNVIQSGTEGIALGQFTLGADIINVNVDNSSNNVSLSVKRSSGEGEITGIKFIFSDETDSEIITEKVVMNKLEEKRFMFHLNKLNVSGLISISIVPVLSSSSGKETLGSVLSKYNIQEGTSTAGTTEETGNQTCVPISNPCGTAVCGNVNNGTCGQISCGSCGTGTCNSTGGCVLNTSRVLCEPNTYYIDFENGNDNNNGTCSNSAWKHAPGDSNAIGNPHSTILHPGDTVRFKGGVVYNTGAIYLTWSGTSGSPITYSNYSGSMAIIDGTGFTNTYLINGRSYESSWVTVENLEVRNYWRYGVWIQGDHNIVQNCKIHTGLGGSENFRGEPLVSAAGDYNKLIHNEVYDSLWNCIDVRNGNHNEVAYNDIYGCPYHGAINIMSDPVEPFYGLMEGNNIHHNYVHDTGDGSIYTRHQQNNTIYNNILAPGPESVYKANIYLSNAVLYNFGPTYYVANTEIYNNLIIGEKWSIFNDAASNVTIKNNIMKDPTDGVFISFYPQVNGSVIDYNLYNITPGTLYNGVWRFNGNQYSSISSLPALGYESHGLMGNPALVDEANENYMLRSYSDAINRGTDLSSRGITNDYAGVSRPQGSAWDIGPYEYVN